MSRSYRHKKSYHLTDQPGRLSGLNSTAQEGTKGETICSQGQSCTDEPDLDDPMVGLFEAFIEKGEIKAAFSGHGESSIFCPVQSW